jgi:hypothetical protein
MAITGTFVPATPGPVSAGLPPARDCAEGSSQTFTLGAPVVKSGGYLVEAATDATKICGFAAKAALNGATDGAKTGRYYEAGPMRKFAIALSVASWDQSLVGSAVGLSKFSSTWIAVTATALSASKFLVIEGLENPNTFVAGDSRPVVLVSVLNANVQGEVA